MRNLYVLKKANGEYVAMDGYHKSYTKILEMAKIFNGRDQAIKNATLENERPYMLLEVLLGYTEG